MSPYVPDWKAKRAANAERIAALRDATPVDSEELARQARMDDAAVRARLRGYLDEMPDHPSAALWRAVLEKGWWGISEWREAAALTRAALDRRAQERAPVSVQKELF